MVNMLIDHRYVRLRHFICNIVLFSCFFDTVTALSVPMLEIVSTSFGNSRKQFEYVEISKCKTPEVRKICARISNKTRFEIIKFAKNSIVFETVFLRYIRVQGIFVGRHLKIAKMLKIMLETIPTP